MKLPTHLGKLLLLDHFKARMEDVHLATDAVGQFQRMALVADMDTTLETVKVYFKPSCTVIAEGTPEYVNIQLCYDTVKKDILGMAVDCLVGIVNSQTGATKEKIAAAAVLNELYGERQLVEDHKLTDKLVIDLVGAGHK